MEDWAESAVRRAEESGRWWSLAGRARPAVVRVLLARAIAVRRKPDKASCLRYAEWAVRLAEEIGEVVLLARALAERGNARRLNHDLPAAKADLDRALEMLPEGALGVDAAEVWSLQASLLLIRGDYEEGAVAARAAMELYRRVGPDQHLKDQVLLGLLLAHARDYEGGQAQLLAAIERLEVVDPQSELMSVALINAVWLWVDWLVACREPWRRSDLMEYATDGLHHVLPHAEKLPVHLRPRLGVIRGVLLLGERKYASARRQLFQAIEELFAHGEIEQAGIAAVWFVRTLATEGS